MDIQAELERESPAVSRISAVARYEPSVCFGKLMRPGDPGAEWLDRLLHWRDPGARFTSATRMIVFEYHGGQLRYYAGGFVTPLGNPEEPHDRMIQAEGSELGDFPSVQAALTFTEAYLVDGLDIQSIEAPRLVHWRQGSAAHNMSPEDP